MRWPPVIFTIGMAYLSATSAMRRSSAALVTPPSSAAPPNRCRLLNIGVGALVDEAALRIVPASSRPGGDQVIVQRRRQVAQPLGAPFQGMASPPGMLVRWASRMALRTGVVVVGAAANRFFGFRRQVGGAADGGIQDLLAPGPQEPQELAGLGAACLMSSTLVRPFSGWP